MSEWSKGGWDVRHMVVHEGRGEWYRTMDSGYKDRIER